MVATLWLVPVLAVPLLLAALVLWPTMRAHALAMLPWAPLPALAAALAAPAGVALEVPFVLLDMRLALDGPMRTMLGFAALVWCLAGLFAHTHLRDDPRRVRFAALWLLTLAGSLGVIVAADVATFYAAFACLSLAAYPLVVHTRTTAARRAGTVYIALAVLGEACLLAAFVVAAGSADSLAIVDVRAALGDGVGREAALALLIVGFGIKMGMVPLHVWLPLAHPAAPTAASAMLSGVLVKAGVVGLMQFLPDVAAPDAQAILLWAGLAGAYYGAAVGLCQRDPKAVLAYSTVSQMGLVIALLALLPGHDARGEVLDGVVLYSVHHGLAKAALFLGVGVALAAGGGRVGRAVLLALCVPALSLAGAPLTAGAVAKTGAKALLGDGTGGALFAASAVGTALLLMRFLWLLRGQQIQDAPSTPAAGLVLPWGASVVAMCALPWWLGGSGDVTTLAYQLRPGTLGDGLWPIVAALATGWLVSRWSTRGLPRVPEGDLLWPLAAGMRGGVRCWARWVAELPRPAPGRVARLRRLPWRRWSEATERALSRWPVAGTLLILVALALVR